MKNLLLFFKNGIFGMIVLIIIIAVAGEIFQGQTVNPIENFDQRFNYDESDPLIDRPTRESLQHATETEDNSDVITDASGFDNFEIGVDNAEQMLVSNPRNPLNMQFGVNGTTAGQRAYYTVNGHDWISSNPSYHPSTCCDPWSAWDSLGVLHYGSGVLGQYVYNSTDGGQTYGLPILSVDGNDRNTMAADQTGGPYANYLYAAITPGNFARSTNVGVNWTQTFTASNTIPGVMIAVGPNGSIQGGTVVYVTNTGDALNVTYNFYRSNLGGASGSFTLRSSLTVAGIVGTVAGLPKFGRMNINGARTRPYPMIAMDNSYGPHRGRLYLVYASNAPAGNGKRPNIILQYSNDQALSWSPKITVNNDTTGHQWFPAIWCEKETGRLYIKWYDTRENPATYAVNVYATYTDNGGATFATNQKLTTQSWTYPSPSCGTTNCYRGDYDGMTANPKTSFSVWYDGRQNTFKNVGAYFPDFAMQASPSIQTIHQTNDSRNFIVKIPAVKLYTDVVKFTTSVSPIPSTGSIVTEFLEGDSLNNYPDSVYMKARTVGTVTPGSYTITITGSGSNGTPVHKRTVTLTVDSSSALQLTGYIEAFYNQATHSMVSDTVRAYLRSTISPYNLVDSSKGILSTAGTGTFNFSNAANGTNYYLVVKHRNSIETWSSSGNAFVLGALTYDFSTAANKAYGNNVIQVDPAPLRFAFFSGDVNQDGFVDLADVIQVYNDGTNFVTGYVSTDVNGNNITDLTDLIFTNNNSNSFVKKITPP